MPATDTKALLLQIDASVELLKKNLQAGDAAVAHFQTSTSTKLAAMEHSFEKVGVMAEGAAKKFELLRGGLEAIGLALPGLALGEMVRKGLEFAASIGEQAKQAGISVEKLQELRYAATQTGVAQESLQTTLVRLSQNLGKAELGSSKLQKAFEAIGISQADLKNHTATSDEAFAKLADKMHELGPGAEAAGLAATVVGRSWAEAAPLLYAGSQKVDELAKAARDLGIVLSDRQIQSAEETAHKLKELDLVLSANIAKAVADNASSIMTLVNALAKLVDMTGRAITGLKLFRLENMQKEQMDYAENGEPWGNMRDMLPTAWGGRRPVTDASRKAHLNHAAAIGVQIDRLRNGGSAWVGWTPSQPPPLAGGAHIPDILGGGGRKHHDDTAERLRDTENKTYEAAKRELDQKKQLLEAQQKLTIDTEDRNNIALDIIQADHDLKALEIKHNLGVAELDPKITDAKKAELAAAAQKQLALNDQLTTLQRQEANQQAELARQQQYEETQQAFVDAKLSRLQSEDGLAETMGERRRVEMEILQITYQEKRAALDRYIAATVPDTEHPGSTKPAHTADDLTRALIKRDELDRNHALEIEQTARNTAGPMEEFLRTLPDTADKAAAALQNVEVQGLQSISQGIVDVIDGTKSLGQAFHDIANQIIADLLRIAVEKEIIGPLANMLFGGGGGGAGVGGDVLAALGASTGTYGGARAAGGPVDPGKVYRVGERGEELFVPKAPGTIIPNHMLGRGGGDGGVVNLSVRITTSDMLEAHVQEASARTVAAATPAISARAAQHVVRLLTRPGING